MSVEACLAYASLAAVFTRTTTGGTARRMALLRLPTWTLAIAPEERTCQHLQFSAGVLPIHEADVPPDWNRYVEDWVRAQHLTGDLALLTGGPSPREPQANRRLELVPLQR